MATVRGEQTITARKKNANTCVLNRFLLLVPEAVPLHGCPLVRAMVTTTQTASTVGGRDS